MRLRLFLVFLAVPVIEIVLFIQIGGLIGTWPTVAIVILTALIGATLVRRQGLEVLARLQRELQAGIVPASALAEGAMLMAAGLLLLTPGFFTDTLGFALLMPPVRRTLAAAIASRVEIHASRHSHAGPGSGPGTGPGSGPGTVDGEWEEVPQQTVEGREPK